MLELGIWSFDAYSMPPDPSSQRHFHSVIRDTRIDPSLSGHRADLGGDLMFVAGHNFRSAMRDDCARDAFFHAPCQLRPNRRVTDQRFAAFADERARYRGAIADVDLHALKRCTALVNKDEIGRVENASAPGADAISDRRRKNRMFDRERFECYSKNFRRRTFSNYVAIFDGILLQFLPRFFRRIHRTSAPRFNPHA